MLRKYWPYYPQCSQVLPGHRHRQEGSQGLLSPQVGETSLCLPAWDDAFTRVPTLSCPNCPPRACPSRIWHFPSWSSISSALQGPTSTRAPKDLNGGKDLRGGPAQLPFYRKGNQGLEVTARAEAVGEVGFAGGPILVSE